MSRIPHAASSYQSLHSKTASCDCVTPHRQALTIKTCADGEPVAGISLTERIVIGLPSSSITSPGCLPPDMRSAITRISDATICPPFSIGAPINSLPTPKALALTSNSTRVGADGASHGLADAAPGVYRTNTIAPASAPSLSGDSNRDATKAIRSVRSVKARRFQRKTRRYHRR